MNDLGGVTSQVQFGGQTDRYGMNLPQSSGGHNTYGTSGTQFFQGGMTPLSLSANTAGSNAQATAWRTSSADPTHPASYTAQSSGSIRNFNAAGSTPRIQE